MILQTDCIYLSLGEDPNKVSLLVFPNQHRLKRDSFTISGVLILKWDNFRGTETLSRSIEILNLGA